MGRLVRASILGLDRLLFCLVDGLVQLWDISHFEYCYESTYIVLLFYESQYRTVAPIARSDALGSRRYNCYR